MKNHRPRAGESDQAVLRGDADARHEPSTTLYSTFSKNCLVGAMSIAHGEKVDCGQHFVKIKLVKDQFSRGQLRQHTVRRRHQLRLQDGEAKVMGTAPNADSLGMPPLTDWNVGDPESGPGVCVSSGRCYTLMRSTLSYGTGRCEP